MRTVLALSAMFLASTAIPANRTAPQPKIAVGQTITLASHKFRDLNRNGTLEPYEDWRLPDATRARAILFRG